MKKSLKIILWILLSCALALGVSVVTFGSKTFYNAMVTIAWKVLPVTYDPQWRREVPEYAWSLRDIDNIRQSVRKIGVNPVVSKAETPKDLLYKVTNDEGYIVQATEPYLVPQANALLREIGERYNAKCDEKSIKSRFFVTSAFRTMADLERLKRSGNENVSDKSLHLTGTTFDITYSRFYSPIFNKADVRECDEILASILTQMQKECKCWVLREINQPCYHITVRPGYKGDKD